jgi:hypothetical protein
VVKPRLSRSVVLVVSTTVSHGTNVRVPGWAPAWHVPSPGSGGRGRRTVGGVQGCGEIGGGVQGAAEVLGVLGRLPQQDAGPVRSPGRAGCALRPTNACPGLEIHRDLNSEFAPRAGVWSFDT